MMTHLARFEFFSEETFCSLYFYSDFVQKFPRCKSAVCSQFLIITSFYSFCRNAELAKPVHRLYRGTLRVLLVLLHDFPEFLCDYHYSFCDVIPPNCIQMRNLILSAFPRNMRLPDPFTPNLKVKTGFFFHDFSLFYFS